MPKQILQGILGEAVFNFLIILDNNLRLLPVSIKQTIFRVKLKNPTKYGPVKTIISFTNCGYMLKL